MKLLCTLLVLPLAVWSQVSNRWAIPWNNPVSAILSTSVWDNWSDTAVKFDKEAASLTKPNDIAQALSVFLARNTALYRGVTGLTDSQLQELRQKIVALFWRNEALKKMTDPQKQELYELLVSYSGLAHACFQESMKRGDQQGVNACRRLAGQNLRAVTHLEPDRFVITPQGLTIKPE